MTDIFNEEIKHSVYVAESRMRTAAHSVADTADRARGFADELREALDSCDDPETEIAIRVAIGQFDLIAKWNDGDAGRLRKEGRI